MSTYQEVLLVGHLGQDPEVRYLQNGTAVCNCSIATSRSWKDNNGERQERTEWHRVVFWRKLAETAGQYLHKGSKILVRGEIQSRKYTDQQGVERTSFEIIGHFMQMMSSKQEGNGNGNGGNGNGSPQQAPPEPEPTIKPETENHDTDYDDLPF